MVTRASDARSNRLTLVLAALAMLLIGQIAGPLAGLADDSAGTPETVVCETAPIDDARYAEAAANPSDDVGLPDPIPYEAPVGTMAEPDTIDRVRALLGQVVACVNEGRNAAFLSLFSMAWLERHVSDLGAKPDDREATPIAAEMRLALVRVMAVTALADGRVTALVFFEQPGRDAPELTSMLTFVELDGRLLIDDWQPVMLADAVVPTPTPVTETWEMVSGPGYTGVIAPLEEAPTLRTGYGTTASGWWLPTAEQIAQLEADLPGYLLTLSFESTPSIADNVDTYLRQYAGLVIEGRALIFVNALCQDPTDGRWTSEPVFVDDGGDCFFQIYYEPSTGSFRELHINGEA